MSPCYLYFLSFVTSLQHINGKRSHGLFFHSAYVFEHSPSFFKYQAKSLPSVLPVDSYAGHSLVIRTFTLPSPRVAVQLLMFSLTQNIFCTKSWVTFRLQLRRVFPIAVLTTAATTWSLGTQPFYAKEVPCSAALKEKTVARNLCNYNSSFIIDSVKKI
jgi:hypothetical protein